jgi:hypothetical protein
MMAEKQEVKKPFHLSLAFEVPVVEGLCSQGLMLSSIFETV